MNEVITVSQLNRYVNLLLEADPALSSLSVKGEISSLKKYPSGHFYFTLKDDKSAVSCVMFRTAAQGMSFLPFDGQKVVLYAKASLYDRDGKFQLYVNSMKLDGLGDLFLQFEQLKAKLQQEGLFDADHKKRIPYLPKRIGVVTSSSGAVLRDILHILARRFPDFNLVLVPVTVQGTEAAQSIVSAIRILNDRNDIDVIIVGRGGGSIEDLWCFNEEIVARAVYASRIPVVSAVGHETDYTICDFVADLRAPTPSAAAELVMPVKSDCYDRIRYQTEKLSKMLRSKLDYEKLKLDHIKRSRVFIHPESLYEDKREAIDSFSDAILRNVNRIFERKRLLLTHSVQQLDGLSPLKVLQRGYGVPQNKKSGSILRSVEDTRPGDEIMVRVLDGELDCSVLSVRKEPIH